MLLKKLKEYFFLWVLGGSLYYSFEMIFRGFSHSSMFVLGGICMDFFAVQGRASKWREPMWIQVIRCTTFVVACEFITGIIVNKWLKLKVWDYSDQPFHLFGQICLPFAVIFSALCAAGILLSGYLLHWLFKEEKPKFRVL
ncbi:MAG: hypothetical protein IJZ53_08000 [Tyzzerella sp.]|nr:hypothetical protein [Tyzzerella sp.]